MTSPSSQSTQLGGVGRATPVYPCSYQPASLVLVQSTGKVKAYVCYDVLISAELQLPPQVGVYLVELLVAQFLRNEPLRVLESQLHGCVCHALTSGRPDRVSQV